jgi:acyl dehydratase
MTGRPFEKFQVGETITHAMRRTVTETDNLLFTTLTHNPQPLHLDAEYASQTEFGQIVVNGLFTLSLMVGISAVDTTLGTLVANLGYDAVAMPRPVFIGDTLHFETTVIEKRESRSRSNAGIVTFEHHCFNQRGELVCQARRSALMQRQAA